MIHVHWFYCSNLWVDKTIIVRLPVLAWIIFMSFAADLSAQSFANIDAMLQGVANSSVAWGDYDDDNDFDILLTGSKGSICITKIYRNTGGSFNEDTAVSLRGVCSGSVAWGDYDNDGDLDILNA